MTVFVTQMPRPNSAGWVPDISSAASYGNIEFIFDSEERVYALPGPSLFKARKVLREFDHEKDYILHPNMTDSMALAITTIALMQQNNHLIQHVKFLYFNRKRDESGKRNSSTGTYYPIKVQLK